jgi:Leucine-rich repeat (LRR) protein
VPQEEQAPPKNILKVEQIVGGLSQVSKTYDGASYAFTNLVLDEKEIEELGESLRSYQHIRFLSMQKNQLKDISEILYIPHLLTFNASENQVASIEFLAGARDSLLYLQQLTLTKNKLTALPSLPLPRLAKLLINENEIASCVAFAGHSCIQYLDLSKNKLTSLEGVSKMPKLQHLDVSENELTEVKDGLQGLPDLRKLILTKNKIASLAGFSNMYKLEHLVLIENQIATAKELVHLNQAVPSLKQLDMMENPAAADNFKTEVLIIQSDSSINLRKLNDEDITDEDRQAAATTKAERIKAEEEARKEAEAKALAGDAPIPEAADE